MARSTLGPIGTGRRSLANVHPRLACLARIAGFTRALVRVVPIDTGAPVQTRIMGALVNV